MRNKKKPKKTQAIDDIWESLNKDDHRRKERRVKPAIKQMRKNLHVKGAIL